MLVAPNLRGDDVGELQSALARIGFDCGRVDGIFGPATARALEDFQHNCGLFVDGVCGPYTVRALSVITRQTGTGPGITALRELEALTAHARSLAELRLVVGQFGGLSALTRQLVQALRQRSAVVTSSDEPDAGAQAASANRFGAHVYVGFESDPAGRSAVHYYAVPQFVSVGGQSLAGLIAEHCGVTVPEWNPEVAGMRLPILRETRMPAVLITLGDVQFALDRSAELVDGLITGLSAWAGGPTPAPADESPV